MLWVLDEENELFHFVRNFSVVKLSSVTYISKKTKIYKNYTKEKVRG